MSTDCKLFYRRQASFGCARINNLQVCNLTDCDNNPIVNCFRVEGSNVADGQPIYGSAQVCTDEVLRIHSETIAINVTPGSANVGIEILPACFDAIVNGINKPSIQFFSTIYDAVNAGRRNICVDINTIESNTINLAYGPVRLFYHPGVVTSQNVTPLFTSPTSEHLEIQNGTFDLITAYSDVLFGAVRANVYNSTIRGQGFGTFHINTIGHPVLLNVCTFDSSMKPDLFVWGNIVPDSLLVSSILNCEFFPPNNRLNILGSNIHVQNCRFREGEMWASYAETTNVTKPVEDVNIIGCTFQLRNTSGSSGILFWDLWSSGNQNVMYSAKILDNNFQSTLTGKVGQNMIAGNINMSGSIISNNISANVKGSVLSDINLCRIDGLNVNQNIEICGNTVRNIVFGSDDLSSIEVANIRIIDNYINGEVRFGAPLCTTLQVNDIIIANNVIREHPNFAGYIVTMTSTKNTAHMTNVTISGNHFNRADENILVNGNMNRCTITGNNAAGIIDVTANIIQCRISDNIFGGGNPRGSCNIAVNCDKCLFSSNNMQGNVATNAGIDILGNTTMSTFTGNTIDSFAGTPAGSIKTVTTSKNNILTGNRATISGFIGSDVIAPNQPL
jgi:hypothetical protein